ncbi:DUF6931 family protein [Aliiroseovarius sp.]|uniref:DUF6931 family protein n=1 Tax=Aliiroseovarius sp. TaxID=1872442 RepID=UPI003BAC1BF5
MVEDQLTSPEDDEKTRPPVSALRFDTSAELFAEMSQLRELIQLRPEAEESGLDFLHRLAESATPEDAVTFTAFAAQPKMAVWWGYECLRNLRSDFSHADRELLEMIAHWSANGETALRYRIMQIALFSEHRTAAVMLGLAAGWSGQQIAPNDPAPIPAGRAPRAVNAAVLSALAQCHLANRPLHLKKLVTLSEPLFRGF